MCDGRDGLIAIGAGSDSPHAIHASLVVSFLPSATLQARLRHHRGDGDWEQHQPDVPVCRGLAEPTVQLEELQRPEPGAAAHPTR